MIAEPEFGTVEDREIPEIAAFLRSVFHSEESWVPFLPEVLRWKALAPHPLWEGSRGFVVRSGTQIVAHGCAMPAQFESREGAVSGTSIMDWAANKVVPGSGVMIFREIGERAGAVFGVGGSEDTQRLLPRMGFAAEQQFCTFEKVLRPVALFGASSGRTARDFARLGRNMVRGLRSKTPSAPGWSARAVAKFGDEIVPVLPRPNAQIACVASRTPALLNYFLGCPAARMEAVIISSPERVAGYAVLAYLQNAVRIAELWIDSERSDHWQSGLASVIRLVSTARPHRIRIGGSALILRQAAAYNSLYPTSVQPIFVKSPTPLVWAASMLDTDAFYLPDV